MSLIVIVVFLLGFAFLFRGRKKTFELGHKTPKLSPSFTKKLVLGYGVLLVLGAIFYFADPNTHLKADTPSLSSNAMEIGDGSQIVFDALNQGVFDPTKGVVKRDEHHFDFQGHTLSLPQLSQSDMVVILVRQTPSSDGKVTVTTYMTRMFVGSHDVTDQLNLPNYTLNRGRLVVKGGNPLNLNYALIAPDFMLNQFNGMDQPAGGFSYSSNQVILLVQVPKNVSIKGAYHSVSVK